MYSFSNIHLSDLGCLELPRYPHFADVLEAVKTSTGMRVMLDGREGFDRLHPEEQHEHLTRCMLWDHLRQADPHEYERQAKAQGRKNSERLLALLRRHDPLFETTWGMLEHMLEILPDTAECLVKKGTHDDASMFLDLYQEMRDWAKEVEHRKHRRKHARKQPKAAPARNAAETRKAKRSAELDALVNKVKSGRAEEGDLLKYIQLSMADDTDAADSAGGWE